MLLYPWEPWITNVDGFNTASKHSQTTKYEVVKLNWKVQVQESRDCLIEKVREPTTHNPHVYWELGTGNVELPLQVTGYRLQVTELAKCILVNRK